MEKEVRSVAAKVEIRSDDGQEQVLTGLAAVYNSPTEMSYGFQEIIEPGFFSNVLTGDTVATVEHNAEKLVGRTISGTLKISDSSEGLRTENTIPDTTVGKDLLTLIKRGDIQGMSFAFQVGPDGSKWETDPVTGFTKRTLMPGGCARLYDVTYTCNPAYSDTSVAMRSLAEFRSKEKEKTEQSSAEVLQIEEDQRKRQLLLAKLK